jgi:hypothetical protein
MQMGLYAILIVDAGPAEAYPGIHYDSEEILLFSEIDPVLHEAVATGVYGTGDPVTSTGLPMTSTMDYNPKFFLINGQPYSDVAAIIAGSAGDDILLRLLNAGLKTKMPLLQGAYLTMLAEDGNPYPFTREQYSIDLAAGKTMDAMIQSAPAGTLAVYDRRLAFSDTPETTGATLVPDLASPQPIGTPEVVFTAGGIGGTGNYEYRFWLYSGGVWTIVQDYSTNNTWAWYTSALPAGGYSAYVHVRSVGSTASSEAHTGLGYVIQ